MAMYNEQIPEDIVKCLHDVIQGFSVFNDKFYIKHLNIFQDSDVRGFYEDEMKRLTDIPTKEDQEAMLIENGIWAKDQEDQLILFKNKYESARETLPNIILKSQKEQLEKKIEDLGVKYFELLSEKNEYMGCTREHIANDNTAEYIIEQSVFLDEAMSKKAFSSKDEIYEDNLISAESLKDAVFFIKTISSGIMCKRIASSNAFQSMISVVPKGEEYKIFETKITSFSSNQISLVQYGQVFRTIFENYEIPVEILDDPEKILDIPKQKRKLEEMSQKINEGERNTSYMGASKEEMAKMGASGTDIFEVLEKSGKKSLGKDDLI